MSFTILNETSDCIELRSKYHFWRLVRIWDSPFFVLSHKHHKNDTYHKQHLPYPATRHNIFYYIREHDAYVSRTIKTARKTTGDKAAQIHDLARR